ncbi:SDR family oxidoreductase [Actinomadura geliboluensis]|uniref:Epimerase n=1 Tax=Actinomadura geliboluensis TaxID=882440 RepID=A0A5S4GV93_9ACTN|nr:epimerase [Actinomadura geliboluensis]TMR36878.1 epimerase [Actinomadura geliboluensis]
MSTVKAVVAGATGRLGRHVVDVLTERGHRVVPVSRATGMDIVTGEGLGEALTGAGVIIGVDKATAGFLAAKKAHEEFLRSGPIPVRILRAAQFHEFVGQLLDWRQGDVAYIPALPSQLVACPTVAEELVGLALDPGSHALETPIPEIAGPRKEVLAEAARLLGARRGVQVVGVDGSGMPDAEIAADCGFLPSPHAKLAGPAFEEWLGSQP